MEEQQISIFKPELVKENPLQLDPESIAYAGKLVSASTNGMIPVTLEEDVVIQRISHDLYAHATSGFRELFNNEARACRTAKKNGANPKIVITITNSKRSLIIQGFDSTGMNQDRFLQVFTKLGRSDNFDGGEIGQFGFGRAAYTTLSEIMILKTWARDTNEKYAVMGKNGIGYNVLPVPNLESFGTRIELTLYEKVEIDSIIKMAIQCARFSEIDTFLNLEEDLPDDYDYREIPRVTGMYKIGPITYQQALDELAVKIEKEPTQIIPIEIHDADFDLYGKYLFCENNCWKRGKHCSLGIGLTSSRYSKHETCLLGTPITASIETNLSCMILNVKDERKYRPTPDRERLTEDAISAIEKKVNEKLSEELQKFLNLKEAKEYTTSKYKPVYNRFASDNWHIYLSNETARIVDFLNVQIVTRDKPTKKTIRDVFEQWNKLVCFGKLNESKIAAIGEIIPNAISFRLENPGEQNHQLLRDNGVIFGDDYLEEKKLKVTRITKELTDVVIHGSRIGTVGFGTSTKVSRASERIGIDMITSDVIKTKDQFQECLELMSLVKTTYKITKDHPKILQGTKYADFITKIESKQFQTSEGVMTLKEIAKTPKKIYMTQYHDTEVVGFLANEKELVFVGEYDALFEIMMYLKYKKKKYFFDEYGFPSDRQDGKYLKPGIFDRFIPERDLYAYNFSSDRYHTNVEDSEILMGIVHAVKKIKNESLIRIFLEAAQNKKENKSLLPDLFSINEQLEKNL